MRNFWQNEPYGKSCSLKPYDPIYVLFVDYATGIYNKFQGLLIITGVNYEGFYSFYHAKTLESPQKHSEKLKITLKIYLPDDIRVLYNI